MFNRWLIIFILGVVLGIANPLEAATPIFSDGFESGILLQSQGGQWQFAAPANSIVTSPVHAGTRALKFDPTLDTDSGIYRIIPSTTQLYAEWYWLFPTGTDFGPAAAAGHHTFRISHAILDNLLARQLDSGIHSNGNVTYEIFWPVANSVSHIRVIDSYPQGSWFRFEILFKLNTVGQANGSLQVWINNVIAFESLNTQYRFDSTEINTFLLTTNWDAPHGSPVWYFDDVNVWNGCPDTGASCSTGTSQVISKSIRLYELTLLLLPAILLLLYYRSRANGVQVSYAYSN